MLDLKKAFENLPTNKNIDILGEKTIALRKRIEDTFQISKDDQRFIHYLSDFKTDRSNSSHSITAYEWFNKLYLQVKEIIAANYNKDENEKLEKQIEEYRIEKAAKEIQSSSKKKLTDAKKEDQIKKMRDSKKHGLLI